MIYEFEFLAREERPENIPKTNTQVSLITKCSPYTYLQGKGNIN